MRGASLWDRFHAKFSPESVSGCWLWTGSKTGRDGRGAIDGGKEYGGKNIYAHRVSWLLYKGQIPDGLRVLHKCDVPSCVNPDHLFLGTQLDNMRDCAAKGRIVNNPRRGEDVARAVLTAEQVAEIKTRVLTTREYAVKFKVTIGTINHIQRGESWAHIVPAFVVQRVKIQTASQARHAAYMRAWNARKALARKNEGASP